MNTRYKATGAAIVAAMIVAVAAVLLWPTQQAAYALGQTIEAVKKVRFLHTTMRDDQGQVMDERWIEMGSDGNQARYRQDANAPQHGVSLLVIDDGQVCYALDCLKNVVMLKPTGSYQWIYNLAAFFESLQGEGSVSIEQNVQYHGRPAHKVRWLKGQVDCYIDPKTCLPLAVGPMELEFADPPADAFKVPKPPEGTQVIDMRNDTAPAKLEKDRDRKKAKLFSEGRKALAEKDYARGVESLGGAIQISPMENWMWYWRGDAYAGLGQWDKAIADYTKVIDLFKIAKMVPYYAYFSRGLAWQQSGDLAKAKADLAVALPVMIDSLRHPEGGQVFDYADMPTDVNAAVERLTPAQRQENMIRRLQKAAGRDFGYEAGMDAHRLEQAIQAAERWWQQHAAEFVSATATTVPAH